jgi:hypothetical protein
MSWETGSGRVLEPIDDAADKVLEGGVLSPW